MAYAVIRTDLMSGVKQPSDLVSLRYYDGGEEVTNQKEVENGVIVKLEKYEKDQREVWIAKAATASDDLNECAIVAGVEVMYDERKKNLDEYINEAGKIVRGYIPRSRNIFSITKEGFEGGVPSVGDKIGIGTKGKLKKDTSNGKFGKCIAIEPAGRYTYYVIQIGKTENGASEAA